MMTGNGPWTLKQLRDELDLNQTEFAEKISQFRGKGEDPWSLKTVSAYEAVNGKPSEKFLQNVASAFGISVDQIIVPSLRVPLTVKIADEMPPYRTEPYLRAEHVLGRQSLRDIAAQLAGLVSDEGVSARHRLVGSEFLFDEIRRRLRAADDSGTALSSGRVADVAAASMEDAEAAARQLPESSPKGRAGGTSGHTPAPGGGAGKAT